MKSETHERLFLVPFQAFEQAFRITWFFALCFVTETAKISHGLLNFFTTVNP